MINNPNSHDDPKDVNSIDSEALNTLRALQRTNSRISLTATRLIFSHIAFDMGDGAVPDDHWVRLGRISDLSRLKRSNHVKEVTFQYKQRWFVPRTVLSAPPESTQPIKVLSDPNSGNSWFKQSWEFKASVVRASRILRSFSKLETMIMDVKPCAFDDSDTEAYHAAHPIRFWSNVLQRCGRHRWIGASSVRYKSDFWSPGWLSLLLRTFQNITLISEVSLGYTMGIMLETKEKPFFGLAQIETAMRPGTLRLELQALGSGSGITDAIVWPGRFRYIHLSPGPEATSIHCEEHELRRLLMSEAKTLTEVHLEALRLDLTSPPVSSWAPIFATFSEMPNIRKVTIGRLDTSTMHSKRGKPWYLARPAFETPLGSNHAAEWGALKNFSHSHPGALFDTKGRCLDGWLGSRSPSELNDECQAAVLVPEQCYELDHAVHWFEEE